jgi:hypothetical protein
MLSSTLYCLTLDLVCASGQWEVGLAENVIKMAHGRSCIILYFFTYIGKSYKFQLRSISYFILSKTDSVGQPSSETLDRHPDIPPPQKRAYDDFLGLKVSFKSNRI